MSATSQQDHDKDELHIGPIMIMSSLYQTITFIWIVK